jgi:hypothetical protein
MQKEFMGSYDNSLSLRDCYLNALGVVRSVEKEKRRFVNSLTDLGYHQIDCFIHSVESVSIVRDTIGREASPPFMNDFDNVILPRLQEAVVRWKAHCQQFGTDGLVTERTVLEQWVEESVSNIAFFAIRSMNRIAGDARCFENLVCVPVKMKDCFPRIHAWQMLHEK